MRNFCLSVVLLFLFYSNVNAFVGCLSGNCYEGYGVYIYPSGGRYEGDFQRANPNGKGKLQFPNGDVYVGEWVNSYRQGVGKMFYHNGDLYEGGFVYSKFHGIGKYTFFVGGNYQGSWQMGAQHGFGIMNNPDGTSYEGSFVAGKKEGVGKLTLPDGKITIGVWENNQLTTSSSKSAPTSIKVETIKIPKIRALIIGVSDYNEMKKLEFSDDDAQHIFDFLQSEAGGSVPLSQIILLKDQQATYKNVIGAANQLFSKANPEDLILFYFSGHGLPGAFLPVDSDGVMHRINHEEVKSLLLHSPAKHKLVFADACHSGSFRSMSENESYTHLLYESLAESSGGLGLLLSSRSEEFSHEFDGIKSGVFSHFLIRGLTGEAEKDKDGLVSVNELFNYVFEQVRWFTQNKQSPVLYGGIDKNMPVSVIR
jgi:hypothetical protein